MKINKYICTYNIINQFQLLLNYRTAISFYAFCLVCPIKMLIKYMLQMLQQNRILKSDTSSRLFAKKSAFEYIQSYERKSALPSFQQDCNNLLTSICRSPICYDTSAIALDKTNCDSFRSTGSLISTNDQFLVLQYFAAQCTCV